MSEGFITVPHTFEVLKKRNDRAPHCLAIDENGTVLGYAMVMLRSFRNLIEVLVPMLETAVRLLLNINYLVMGQICIDKPYRRKGIFKSLYQFYQSELSD